MTVGTTTVRVPTSRLRPAVEAAREAIRTAFWKGVDAAIAEEMGRPEPTTWWRRHFGPHPARTREEAVERLKAPPREFGFSRWDEMWYPHRARWEALGVLADACALGLDAVDVAASDVWLFKQHYGAGESP